MCCAWFAMMPIVPIILCRRVASVWIIMPCDLLLSSIHVLQGHGIAGDSVLSNGFPCAVAKVAEPSGHRAVSLMWSQSNQSIGLPLQCLNRTKYQASAAWIYCKPPSNKPLNRGSPQTKPSADYALKKKGGW